MAAHFELSAFSDNCSVPLIVKEVRWMSYRRITRPVNRASQQRIVVPCTTSDRILLSKALPCKTDSVPCGEWSSDVKRWRCPDER